MLDVPKRKTIRCAVYTRKSSEEGLEQDFNSLHAQREACEAYVASQRHEGWKIIETPYDDGGFSGGSMDRPGLRRLLDDIRLHLIDVVIVYKVDRLTRSLADFAKIVEAFDAHSISFVSVTQQFNTTTSMGRLTLNVLLSFAQFEREVTGERIRDKIAASKRKGMWMGGYVPLGYRVVDRGLVVHDAEAEIVRTIFNLYVEHGCVSKVEEELTRRQIVRPTATTAGGRAYGGRPFGRGEIYKQLSNPTYLGEIAHKGRRYQGQHKAIIDRTVWDAAQAKLAANGHKHRVRLGASEASLLAGLLYDHGGNRLTPTHANKKGRRYRYYALQSVTAESNGGSAQRWRISAAEIETIVVDKLCSALADNHWLLQHCLGPNTTIAERKSLCALGCVLAARFRSAGASAKRQYMLKAVIRVTLDEAEIRVEASRNGILTLLTAPDEPAHGDESDSLRKIERGTDVLTLVAPVALRRRGVETKLIIEGQSSASTPPHHDPALIKAITRAYLWFEDLATGRVATCSELAAREGITATSVWRLLPLAFLAPGIVEAILEGRQPATLTADGLIRGEDIPPEWGHQRMWIGLSAAAQSAG